MNSENPEGPVPAGSGPSASAPIQEGGALGRPGMVLIVDDSSINRYMLTQHVTQQGHQVAAAENGRLALERLQAEKFDLVLLDVMMPEMNGYEVLERMKTDEALRDIPVIMISGLDEIDSVVRCIEAGAADYLPKPFNPVLLRARIGACLEKKWLRDHEVEYLRSVARVTSAAAAIEAGEFEPGALTEVAARPDALGRLARVFQDMAREIYAREQRLKQQVQQLRIEVDEAKRARQVAEITDTDYFQQLQQKARDLRRRSTDAEE
jgi:two-component system, cell cycle response regulator